MDKEKALELAKELGSKHGKAMLLDVCEKLVMPLLDEAVAKSENKIDDLVWLALKDEAMEKLKELAQ